MKRTSILAFIILVLLLPALAVAGSLDGAYRFVSVTFPGGSQTEAQAKGMILVQGTYWANVRSSVDRKTWDNNEPEETRMRKVVAAYQGLTAGCGEFTVEGNVVTMHQLAGANPGAVGSSSKWEYKLEGTRLTLKPLASPGVEFIFEKLP